MLARLSASLLLIAWIGYLGLVLTLEYLNLAHQPHPGWVEIHRGGIAACVLYFLLVPSGIFFWSRRTELWKESVLFLVACLVALLFGQILVVCFYPELNLPHLSAVRERKYHHIYPPNATFREKFSDQIEMEIRTNSDGLRTEYEPSTFNDHSLRVAILGDSFVFGLGVEPEETLSAVLEKELREKVNPDAAVLNCGIVSYSPFLESILFEGVVRKYRPQFTLLFLDATDFSDDVRYRKEAQVVDEEIVFEFRAIKPFRYWGFVVEAFVRPVVLEPLVFPWRLLFRTIGFLDTPENFNLYDTSVVIDGKTENSRFFVYSYPLEKTRPFLEQTYRHISRIAAQAEAVGSQFALIVTPRFHHWNLEECPDNWESYQYTGEEPYQYEYFRFFEEKTSEAPFPIYDLLPAFQDTDRYPLVFERDPHWNSEGHRFVGEKTFDFLRETYFPGGGLQ